MTKRLNFLRVVRIFNELVSNQLVCSFMICWFINLQECSEFCDKTRDYGIILLSFDFFKNMIEATQVIQIIMIQVIKESKSSCFPSYNDSLLPRRKVFSMILFIFKLTQWQLALAVDISKAASVAL